MQPHLSGRVVAELSRAFRVFDWRLRGRVQSSVVPPKISNTWTALSGVRRQICRCTPERPIDGVVTGATGIAGIRAWAAGSVGPRTDAGDPGVNADQGLSAETPKASAAPVSMEAAVRCRRRRRRCLVNMGRSSAG